MDAYYITFQCESVTIVFLEKELGVGCLNMDSPILE
jgi:hypothetical protein